jgi:hypothetical protein
VDSHGYGDYRKTYERAQDVSLVTPQASITVSEIMMLVELGSFFTTYPRIGNDVLVVLTVTIGI